MRVFLTGATGLVGSAIIPELINAGHQVLGLTRSDAGARALIAAGAEVHRGNIEDLKSLRSGAAASDGVIYCAFGHDFSKFAENCEIEKHAINALGAELANSDRPLIVSTGLALPSPTRPVTEDVDEPAILPYPRVAEQIARALYAQGINTTVVRLPQVHNTVKQGLVSLLVAAAREKGVSAYVAEGLNRWPAAHVLDVAHLYRLALEKHEPGARYHAVAEEGVSLRDIAEAIGHGLNVPVVSIAPEDAVAHFGFVSRFAGADLSASSAITWQQLGWLATGPGLIEDLNNMSYFED
jgi:nucleoside-diphosphate-sugar epimerase